MKTTIILLVAFVVAVSGCYSPGERNQGESGYPPVAYRACCDGQESVKKEGEWGMFCPDQKDGAGDEQTCYGPGERNEGAPGKPEVPYKPCCDGRQNVEKANEWGKFCPEKHTATCYEAGERNQGAVGYPAVPYKPCCDGQPAAEKAGDWGKFCPGKGSGSGPTVAPGGCGQRRRRRRL